MPTGVKTNEPRKMKLTPRLVSVYRAPRSIYLYLPLCGKVKFFLIGPRVAPTAAEPFRLFSPFLHAENLIIVRRPSTTRLRITSPWLAAKRFVPPDFPLLLLLLPFSLISVLRCPLIIRCKLRTGFETLRR